MTGVSLERIADTLYPKPEPKSSTAYGTVSSVNPDGSYQVRLNASATTTRCAKLCDAEAGDRVLVLIQANGHCAVIGRVGGSMGAVSLFDGNNTGAVDLSRSAADFSHMRIYYRKVNGQNQCCSQDVYEPNGKNVNLTVFEPYRNNAVTWFASRTVVINGNRITTVDYSNGQISASPTSSNGSEVAIYRVEAW